MTLLIRLSSALSLMFSGLCMTFAIDAWTNDKHFGWILTLVAGFFIFSLIGFCLMDKLEDNVP